MIGGDWKVRAYRNEMQDATDILIQCGDGVVQPFTLVRKIAGEPVVPTFSSLTTDGGEGFLRAVLNCAWDMGLRPDGYLDTRESMRATNAHLQDMRAIAFHKIGADKP